MNYSFNRAYNTKVTFFAKATNDQGEYTVDPANLEVPNSAQLQQFLKDEGAMVQVLSDVPQYKDLTVAFSILFDEPVNFIDYPRIAMLLSDWWNSQEGFGNLTIEVVTEDMYYTASRE